MQRPRSKTTNHANAKERRFAKHTKECDCIVCGQPGPSIVDHALGATFKHNKVHAGHWYLLPLCYSCDKFKSTPNGSTARFIDMTGKRLCDLWSSHIENLKSLKLNGLCDDVDLPPQDVYDAIMDWGR